MPRFKATPQRFHTNTSDSEEDSDLNSLSETQEQIQPHPRKDGNNLISPTKSCGAYKRAIFLAQAVAAMASGSTASLPIAPLGFTIPPCMPKLDAKISKHTPIEKAKPQSISPSPKKKARKSTEKLKSHEIQSSNESSINQTTKPPVDTSNIPIPIPDSSELSDHLLKRYGRDVVKCEQCEKLMRRGSLREHTEMHNNNGRFGCHLCDKKFSRASAREKHLRTHTGERPYACEHCDKAYRQRVHLNEHMRFHTGIRPFVCRLCGFSLASKSLLNRHLRTHGAEANLLSEGEDLWFKSSASKETVLGLAAEAGRVLSVKNGESSELSNDPMREELNEAGKGLCLNLTKDSLSIGRKYLCDVCPAGFPTVQALRSHRKTTHDMVQPHKCTLCEESFTSMKIRQGHVRVKHPYVCPHCDAVMPRRVDALLHRHIERKHPEKIDGGFKKTIRREQVRHVATTVVYESTSGRQTRSRARQSTESDQLDEVTSESKKFKPTEEDLKNDAVSISGWTIDSDCCGESLKSSGVDEENLVAKEHDETENMDVEDSPGGSIVDDTNDQNVNDRNTRNDDERSRDDESDDFSTHVEMINDPSSKIDNQSSISDSSLSHGEVNQNSQENSPVNDSDFEVIDDPSSKIDNQSSIRDSSLSHGEMNQNSRENSPINDSEIKVIDPPTLEQDFEPNSLAKDDDPVSSMIQEPHLKNDGNSPHNDECESNHSSNDLDIVPNDGITITDSDLKVITQSSSQNVPHDSVFQIKHSADCIFPNSLSQSAIGNESSEITVHDLSPLPNDEISQLNSSHNHDFQKSPHSSIIHETDGSILKNDLGNVDDDIHDTSQMNCPVENVNLELNGNSHNKQAVQSL